MRVTKIPAHDFGAALEWIREHKLIGMGILQICHDDGCRAMVTQRDADCSPPCVPDAYLVEPFVASPMEAKAVLN
jgi:hypothetical protein